MTEPDLARYAGEADGTERPGCDGRAEPDLHEVLGLMHLHCIPGEQRAEISQCNPPEPACAHGTAKRPVNGDPGRVNNIGASAGVGRIVRGAVAIRFEPYVLGP